MLRRHAFSLLELLVVCAIIGVLVAIVVPAVQQARLAAERSWCQSNLHQLGLSLEMYRDNFGVYPDAAQIAGIPAGKPMIQDALAGYIEPGGEGFRCPRDDVFFPLQGSSYEYPALDYFLFPGLANRSLQELTQTRSSGEIRAFYDLMPVHGQLGSGHTRNFLYLDGHIDTIDPTLIP